MMSLAVWPHMQEVVFVKIEHPVLYIFLIKEDQQIFSEVDYSWEMEFHQKLAVDKVKRSTHKGNSPFRQYLLSETKKYLHSIIVNIDQLFCLKAVLSGKDINHIHIYIISDNTNLSNVLRKKFSWCIGLLWDDTSFVSGWIWCYQFGCTIWDTHVLSVALSVSNPSVPGPLYIYIYIYIYIYGTYIWSPESS